MITRQGIIRLMSATHVFWYRLTDGLVGARVMGAPVLLLCIRGRKSGQERMTPLLYLADGENLVVVASNGGADNHPGWWLNLKTNLEATAQVRGLRKRVRAEPARGEERGRLWGLVTKMYPAYADYQRRTKREIPVVILRPAEGSEAKS